MELEDVASSPGGDDLAPGDQVDQRDNMAVAVERHPDEAVFQRVSRPAARAVPAAGAGAGAAAAQGGHPSLLVRRSS